MAAVKAGDVVWNITGETKGLDKALKSSGVAITAFGAGITASLGLATKSAATFQSELSKVNTLGVENLEALGDGIKDVTASMGVDLSEATQQTYQIISAGIPEENALTFLEQSAIAAKAGIGELGDAVDLGTSTLNAFGLSAEDAGKIFDITQVAIDQGKTTIGELGGAVGRVAPLFASAGVSAEEMFASISALTTGGIQTSEAVSGLKAALTNILVPGKDAEAAAQRLGVQFNSAGLETLGFVGLMDQLKEATGGNIDEMTQFFPSVEALNAALALTGEQSSTLTETLDMMKDSAGFSAEAFQRLIENNPAEAFNVLKGKVSVLAVEVGEALLPVLKLFIDVVGPMVTGVTELIRTFPLLSSALIIGTGAVGALALAVGPILIALPSLIGGFGLLTGGASLLAGGTALGGVAAAATALVPLLLPLGLAIGGIAAITKTAAFSFRNVATRQRELVETQANLGPQVEGLIVKIEAMGGTVDRTALSGKTLLEQEKLLGAQAIKLASSQTQASEGLKGLSTSMIENDERGQALVTAFEAGILSEETFTQQTKLLSEQIQKEAEAGTAAEQSNQELAKSFQETDAGLRELSASLKAGTITEDEFKTKSAELTAEFNKQVEATKAVTEGTKALKDGYGEMTSIAESTSIAFAATEESLVSIGFSAEGAANALSSSFGPTFSDLVRGFDDSALAAQRLIDKINSIPVLPGGDGIPIPSFAAGGISQGGIARVGENGPELVNLPRGAEVIPAGRSAQTMAGAGAGSGPINITISGVTITGNQDIEKLSRELARNIRQEMAGAGQ